MKLLHQTNRNGQASHRLSWGRPSGPSGTRVRHRAGFTLLEVLVAFTIFFLVAFTILELTTRSLAAVRAIQQREPDVGMVAALLATNEQFFEEGFAGDFDEIFPDLYPGWSWSAEDLEVGSNGLFRVLITIQRNSKKGPAMSQAEVEYYRPNSPPGSASGGAGAF